MEDVNIYWVYWLGMTLNPLTLLSEDAPLSAIAAHLNIARVALQGFINGAPFPRSVERMKTIVETINRILPPNSDLFEDRPLGPSDTLLLTSQIHALAFTLEQESRHSYVVYIQDQKCLSAYSLVEKIENCFSDEAWNTVEDSAKREFKESGRCLALERYTASGFHALRGVECVIRQYIVKLTGELPRKRDWGHYIEVLRDKGADKSLIAVLDNIRSLDRNPLMHPEDWLNIDDAISMFMISQTAISRLVAGIKK